MESINEMITNKEEFLAFMHLLIKKLREQPDKWENKTLESYLEAIVNWTEDMEGFYQNTNQILPHEISWKILADILNAASIYE